MDRIGLTALLKIELPEHTVLLCDGGFMEAGALVVAVHEPDGQYIYNPSGEHALRAGASIIVLAESKDVERLRASVS